jgi:hypothetical protein
MKKIALFAAGLGLLLALAPPGAQALTTTFGANVAQPSDVTTVAGGCGAGWHRGPWGGCRRNYGPGWACIWRYGRRYCR